MKKFLVLFVLIFTGCATTIKVLPESNVQYLIPANTPFKVQMEKGGKLTEIQRPTDTWGVDAGKLATLQEQADACVLKGK